MTAWCRRHPRGEEGEIIASSRRCHGEQGFTLIELLIVVVILPIVIGGIAVAMIAILQNEATTFNKVADSADAQITSANFARDVQSASEVTTGNPSAPGDCGWFPPITPPQPANSTELLSLTWGSAAKRTVPVTLTSGSNILTIPSGSTPFTEADVGSFVSDSALPSGYIPKGATITSWTDATHVVMSAAATSTTNNDTLSVFTLASVVSYWEVPVGSGVNTTYDLVRRFCTQGGVLTFGTSEAVAHDLPVNQGSATVSCPTACNTNSWIPTSAVSSISLSSNESLSGYQFNLSAEPRYSSLPPLPTLLLTGSGQSLNLPDANDILTVKGGIALNTPTGSLAGVSGAQLAASGTISANQCTTNAQGFCPSVTSPFSGTLTCSVNPCVANPIPAPIPVPSISAPATPPTSVGCVTTTSTNCQPGSFPTTPLMVSGDVTFASGNYLFAGPVTIGGGSIVSFGTGQYTFSQGLTIQAGSSIVGNGVFFYFSSSSLSVASTGTNIQLAPLLTGPYAGLLAYQAASDTSPMTLGSGNTGTNVFGGEIEALNATINLGSANDHFDVGSLVAENVVLGSSVSATIGT